MTARYQASRVGRGPWSSHVGNSTPSLHGGTHKTAQMYAEGWIQGAEIQAKRFWGFLLAAFLFFYEAKISTCNFILQPNTHYKVLGLNPS